MKAISLVLLASVSCAPATLYWQRATGQAPAPAPAPAPAAAADPQPAAPADPFAQLASVCTQEDTRYKCPSDDGWPYYLAIGNGVVEVASFENRAFARPCRHFTNAMNDLADANSSFVATCDDGSQQFKFTTTIPFSPDTDYQGWFNNHLQHRSNAVAMLKTVNAIRVDAQAAQ